MKCQRVYPIILGTYKVYYISNGGRVDANLPYLARKQCEEEAIETTIEYLVEGKEGTALVFHNCEKHSRKKNNDDE